MRGLYAAKPWFVRRLRRIEDVLVRRRVGPDALTAAAVLVSIGAGALLALGGALEEPRLWLLVPPLAIVRLALNALDGSVARRTGSGRPFGEVLNEMGDRLADATVLAPLAFVVPPALALAALAATLFASAAGLLGRVVSEERLSGGPMGKADRVIVVGAGALAGGIAGDSAPIVVATWVVLAGALVTAGLRVAALYRATERDADVRV